MSVVDDAKSGFLPQTFLIQFRVRASIRRESFEHKTSAQMRRNLSDVRLLDRLLCVCPPELQ